MDDGPTSTCCRFATDDEIREDPDAFDCETCEWRLHEAALTDGDRLALRLYQTLSRRVVHDLGLVPLVFDIFRLRVTLPEAHLLLAQLDVIHSFARPVRGADAAEDPTDG